MRQAHQDFGFLSEDGKTVFGISYGYGGCAEHEWGFKGLLSALGFKNKEYPVGVEDRVIPALSEHSRKNVHFSESSARVCADPLSGKKTMTLPRATLAIGIDVPEYGLQNAYGPSYISECIDGAQAPYDLRYKQKRRSPLYDQIDGLLPVKGPYGPETDRMINSQWDEKNAVITVFGRERVRALRSLYEALLKGTASITLSGAANPFSRGSLCLCDTSKISPQRKQLILESDLNHKAFWERVNATHIIPDLAKAGKGYYALSPRLDDDGELKFFLNPRSQDKYSSGWFSEQDLREWIKEKGPVCKANLVG